MTEAKEKKWELVQIKAFKVWVNSSLQSKGITPVEDMAVDFQDGLKFIAFLEIVSGKSVGKYDKKPGAKIQKIQNLNLALKHIQENLGVKVLMVGAEDIYDGKLKLILGMLWTLFRHLQLNSIKADGAENPEDALLIWVKKMTEGYDGINITNFKDSFKDGLAFSALIHKFDPKLIDYNSLKHDNAEGNLNNAFGIAEQHLGLPRLLDTADFIEGHPDERSVILYISLFFHAFVATAERRKAEEKSNEITKKMTSLEDQLQMMEEENAQLLERRKKLEKDLEHKEAEIEELNSKGHLMEDEIQYLMQKVVADAENYQLLEEKNKILMDLLENEALEKGQIEEARARLLAEIEEMKRRSRLLAGEKEGLDEMRRRLITENEKKSGSLADLEARKNALQNEIEQLRKLVNAEMDKRKNAIRTALQLKKELDELRKKQISQGKARVGLDVLRRNLEEHLEDMYRWRELHELTEEDNKRVFDLDKVTVDMKNKNFEEQLNYLDDHLQSENKNLIRIIRLKDSGFKLKEVEVKSGWLLMKGRKDWKRRWFSLKGFTLYYFENETVETWEGFVDLNKGCEVVRQKAVKEDDSAKKQWPLKITVGERKLFVRAATKKERHSWYLFLASKIAHLNYLRACEAGNVRADTRLITLFQSETITDLHLDHRPLFEQAAVALVKALPAHDEIEAVSLMDAGIDDVSAHHIGDVLEKLNIRTLDLSKNKITSAGAEEISKGIGANTSLTQLNLEDNQIDSAGVIHLAANLASKPALTLLNLNGNRINSEGVKALVEHLGNAERVFPDLHLGRNQLGDEGAKEVGKLLKANPNITNVDLSGNKIGNKGVESLLSQFGPETGILSLDLSNNDIGTEGGLAVEKFLRTNSTIRDVNLSGNKNLKGSEALNSLLKEGFSFNSLSINRVF